MTYVTDAAGNSFMDGWSLVAGGTNVRHVLWRARGDLAPRPISYNKEGQDVNERESWNQRLAEYQPDDWRSLAELVVTIFPFIFSGRSCQSSLNGATGLA